MENEKKPFVFRGPYKEYCQQYISFKKSCGYIFTESQSYLLRHMDEYFNKDNLSKPILTKNMVECFISKRNIESEKTRHMRMSIIRQFALFMNNIGFDFYVLPYDLVPIVNTFTPYIFTHKEINDIIFVTDNLKRQAHNKFFHLVYPMLFRILYACGLRINEALSLKKLDIDIENGIIKIHKAKNNTSRLIPMSSSLSEYCCGYIENMKFDMNSNGYFFPTNSDQKRNRTTVYIKFKEIMKSAGIFPDGQIGPRVHDIRHTYAVHALEKMIDNGQDIYCTLPILSSYLGHRGIESTEHYLRLTKDAHNRVLDAVKPLYADVYPKEFIDE